MYSFLPHLSLGKNCRGRFWNRPTFTERRRTTSRWYIWVLQCPLFLLGSPFLNRRRHTEVAVREVSNLLNRWSVTRSYDIPSPTWKSESILNVIFVICTQELAKIRYFRFCNFLCVTQCYRCGGPKGTEKEREKEKCGCTSWYVTDERTGYFGLVLKIFGETKRSF
jgi:hypothetical protein